MQSARHGKNGSKKAQNVTRRQTVKVLEGCNSWGFGLGSLDDRDPLRFPADERCGHISEYIILAPVWMEHIAV